MKLTETQWLWLGIGASVLAWGGYTLLSRGGAHRQPSTFYLPGQTAHVYQGQSIVVRLPRGGYTVLGGDDLVQMLSQAHHGVNTDIALLIGGAPNAFTVIPRFVDTTTAGREYSLTIVATPVGAT